MVQYGDSPGSSIADPQEVILLDARPVAAYSGWSLKGEKRGGHLPGAKSLPLGWSKYMDWVEVLEEKKISPERPVVVYGYDGEETRQMAERLCHLGFREVMTYTRFLEWSADTELPLEQLPRFRHLVYPDWVNRLIRGERPPHYDNDRFVICHSHYDHIEDYHRGHIPGAIPLDTNSLESTETWNRRTPEELEETLSKLGIRHDTTVVIYGRFSFPTFDKDPFPGKSAGHLGAIRSAAILLYAGVKDIRILNGGLNSWEAEGYGLSTEPADPVPVEAFGVRIPAHPEYMIDTPEAKQYLAGKGLSGSGADTIILNGRGEFPEPFSGTAGAMPITWRTTATSITPCGSIRRWRRHGSKVGSPRTRNWPSTAARGGEEARRSGMPG